MMRMTRTCFAAWAAVGLLACSSDDSALEQVPAEAANPKARAGEIRQSEVWKDGTFLTGTVTIAPGVVVEIAPGATVKCAEGAAILVGGELRAEAADKPAKITCTSWLGLLVAKGGKLALSGVTLENPQTGITTTEGALASTFSKGAITSSMKPLQVGKASSLLVENVKVTTPAKVSATEVSISEVRGKLEVKHLDYDAGPNQGLSARDGGELVVEDSDLHGNEGLDMVAAYDAKSVTVRYSTLRGAHCGPHIQGVEKLEIDHVTSESNTYGITLYKTGAGPHVVKESNFIGAGAWLDFQGDHGPITMQNVFVSGAEVIKGGPPPTITKAAQRIATAKPR